MVAFVLGGMVAYEMAQQLQSQGKEVPMPALLEAFPHDNRFKSIFAMSEQLSF